MKLFKLLSIIIMLAISTNASCFLGDIVRGVGDTAANVVGGATDVAADIVDGPYDSYYGRYPGYRYSRPVYRDVYYDDVY